MKLLLNKIELEKINKLLISKENNIDTAELYIDYLNNLRGAIDKNIISYYRNDQKCNLNKAYYYSFLDILGIDENDKEFIRINKNSHIDKMHELNPNEYLENPYYRNIKFSNHKEDNWELTNLKYIPFEGFVYDELIISKSNYEEETPFGFFKEKFSYPCVIEDDTIWMSITPHEINTMKESIKEANGDVLVIGLGLGYYAYMVARKDNVNKVTIIEKDKRVIDLFIKFILPQFECKTKIEVIEEDAFNFLDEVDISEYNYCFADIWHNVGDGEELYLMIKARENKHPSTKFSYWIETSILAMLRRQLLTVFEEELSGADDDNYLQENDENDRIINSLHFLLKDVEISSYEQFKNLLSNTNLAYIAGKLNYLTQFKK